MSITLITGVPGSGKTLKAVWDHLRPMVGKVEKSKDHWGRIFEVPRIVFTNVNGFLLDHELIEGGGTWTQVAKEWKFEGNEKGLRGWHTWAKPGAVICFDEFQKFWPPRPNGAGVPPDIQALDTHRHMGVDFILVTQNCRNVDRHILGLVDRHLHVRRVANMPLAVVYEWDHASVSLNYKNSMSKSPWRYPRQAYKLYKSAELHTKQARKLPGLVWFILAGLAGAAYGAPVLFERYKDRTGIGKDSESIIKAEPTKAGTHTYVKDGMRVSVDTVVQPAPLAGPTVPPADGSTAAVPVPPASAPGALPSGCIVVRERCGCFDSQGMKVPSEPAQCLISAGVNGVPKAKVEPAPVDRPFTPSEADAVRFSFSR